MTGRKARLYRWVIWPKRVHRLPVGAARRIRHDLERPRPRRSPNPYSPPLSGASAEDEGMYIEYSKHCQIDQLIGKVVNEIRGMEDNSDCIVFVCSDGSEYTMFHSQDCCESVSLNDVEGDASDLIGLPIVVAEEVSSDDADEPEGAESYTWTFYRIATGRGFVVLRWLGESNGYYSESVDFAKTK